MDLARRAEQLFLDSDERLQQKLLEYVLSNIELNDKKLSYTFTDPFKSIVEAKKKTLAGQNSEIWLQQMSKSFHLIKNELARWRKILEVPYLEYLLGR